jgi:hypothetical protein
MDNELFNAISVVVALTTIFSAVITAFINGLSQIWLRSIEMKRDFYNQTVVHNRDILENYLKCAGHCVSTNSDIDFSEYSDSYYRALMHASPDIRVKMMKANSLIASGHLSDAGSILESIAPAIDELIKNT